MHLRALAALLAVGIIAPTDTAAGLLAVGGRVPVAEAALPREAPSAVAALGPAALQVPPELPTTATAPDERYRVFLLTMDQGDEIWERFGHNAILIRDRLTGQDLAWNWGLFDFGAENFALRFIRGTMTFSMGPSELGPTLDAYARANRTVYSNEVFLTQEEARSLDDFVRWNFAPENREYVYDYFLDNCSTRTRDALDGILGGLLREQFGDIPTELSYRDHVHRLVHETVWLDQSLSFLLGSRGDAPLTEWDTMFIPMEMMRVLEGAQRPDGAGGSRPLLGRRQVLFQAERMPAPAEPPGFPFWWLAVGGLTAAVVLALGAAVHGGKGWGRVGLAAFTGLWGLLSGILGALLVTIWFTGHEFGYWNVNLFYMSPLGLAVAVACALVLFHGWHGSAGRLVLRLALLVAGLSVILALIQALSIVRQGNPEVIALALPVNLAIVVALLAGPRAPPATSSPVPRPPAAPA